MNADNTNTNDPTNGLNDDKPLDPAVERVRRKMMRLMGISVAIMMVGLMAVIGAIFYKISGGGKKNIATPPSEQKIPIPQLGTLDITTDIVGNITLPQESRILKANMDNGRILLSIRHGDGAMSLWVYDLAANRVFARIAIDQ